MRKSDTSANDVDLALSVDIQGQPWPLDDPLPFGMVFTMPAATMLDQIRAELRRRHACLHYDPDQGWQVVSEEGVHDGG